MDPQATWGEMIDALATGDFEAAADAAEVLTDWLKRGGFPPQSLSRGLPADWDRSVCLFVCGQVLANFRNQEMKP